MKRAIEALSYEKSENTVGWGFHPNEFFKKHKTLFVESFNLNRKSSSTSGTITKTGSSKT
ncbi:MAG: hypothetical protein ACI4CY_02910 [Candidatus Gastranaerophilaceae bacterium]